MNPEARNRNWAQLGERRYPKSIVLIPSSWVTGRAPTIAAKERRYWRQSQWTIHVEHQSSTLLGDTKSTQSGSPEARNRNWAQLGERRYPKGIVLIPSSWVTGRAPTIVAKERRYWRQSQWTIHVEHQSSTLLGDTKSTQSGNPDEGENSEDDEDEGMRQEVHNIRPKKNRKFNSPMRRLQ